MSTGSKCIVKAFCLVCLPLLFQDAASSQENPTASDSWTKALNDRAKRGTLHDVFQKVRGDSGKWNDEPRLQYAPPIKTKPPKQSLDDWADQLQRTRRLPLTSDDDNWLLFKTRQLDDNDRVWVERIERRGNRFTIVLDEAIWQGRYSKTFTYFEVFGVNLGKLAAGEYEATLIIKPLEFGKFAGNGRPIDEKRIDNLPQDEQAANKKAKELSVAFIVVPATR